MNNYIKKFSALLVAAVILFSASFAGFDSNFKNILGVEAHAAGIPAVSDSLDYRLIKCKDELSYISFLSLSGSYSYSVTLSNSEYGFSQTASTSSSSSQRLYIWYDLGAYASRNLSSSFSWELKITTYSGSTEGGTRTWTGLVDNCCGFVSTPINYYGIMYNYNDGTDGYFIQDWPGTCSGTTTITSITPTRSGYTFLGLSASSSATSPSYYPGNAVSYDHNNLSLYAVWKENAVESYTIYYNSNGGSGAPSSQTKTKDVTLWLSSTKPTKTYTVTYNANGGSISPTSKNVNCTFVNWNTSQNGSGTTYSSGSSYTANSGATLYAQWNNPTYGTLPVPTRNDYSFDGWYTSSTGGTLITSSSTVSSNTTIYAHWKEIENIYNLGEETYSFNNFRDDDADGHCFGMSVTSSGYYTGELDLTAVGGSSERSLYSLSKTSTVTAPICYYHKIQGNFVERNAIVAGGSIDLHNIRNISSDWISCVNYVKNHDFDNKGVLNIGMWYAAGGGHAVNFLYYKEVNGQQRIYAYDNNFPEVETYFYMGDDGYVHQAPMQTLSSNIIGIDLLDTETYFDLAPEFDFKHYIYADEKEIKVEGAELYYLKSGPELSSYVMYEIPENVTQVSIIPLVDNASFEYNNESYEFGEVDSKTCGVLTVLTKDSMEQKTEFEIVNAPDDNCVASIASPSTTSISYGDSIILHTDVNGALPAGARIEWTANNGNFDMSVSADGLTCKISPKSSGKTVFAATVYDKDGNAISTDTQEMTAKAGFFDKIVAFFKKIFGLTKTIPEAFKGIF